MNAFTRALQPGGDKKLFTYFPNLKKSQWSCVEFEKGLARFLYFDLNGNGKLSPDERISAQENVMSRNSAGAFVTPDFSFAREDGETVPFRLRLDVEVLSASNTAFVWSPSCVWQGSIEKEGRVFELTLFDHDLNACFLDFGTDAAVMNIREAGNVDQHGGSGGSGTVLLSSLLPWKERFYRLRLHKDSIAEKTIHAELKRHNAPMGLFEIAIESEREIGKHVIDLRINGVQDENIILSLPEFEARVPAGTYRIKDLFHLFYEAVNGEKWQVNVKGGAPFEIEPEKVCRLTFGRPELTVQAMESSDFNKPGAEARTVFPAGTAISIVHEIWGLNGEVYERFIRNWRLLPPRVRILGPAGEEIISGDMEAG
jgi:hypothetical protein